MIDALHGLATRRVSASELGGPIMIAQASVQAARGGSEQLLFLIALISDEPGGLQSSADSRARRRPDR